MHVVDVIDDDATLQPAVDQPFRDVLYLRHVGVATTAGHSNVIVSPEKPGPQAKDCFPNAAPQSVESTYVYEELKTVGAFAERTAPTEDAPVPPAGIARLSAETEVAPCAAILLRLPPEPVVVVDATTPVKLVSVALSRDTRAAPEPPRTYFATMPFAAAAGDLGHTTFRTGCEKPLFPTSTVAVCSASFHFTIDRSRKGTVKLKENVPLARDTGAPLALFTATLRTRESRGRIGSKSTAVVGRAAVAASAPLAAVAALVPPTAAMTASAVDAPVETPSARKIRRTGEFARAAAAAVAAAICASLTATGGTYTRALTPAASLNGLTPHCVMATQAPGATAARRAASEAVDASFGSGCALTMRAGNVTRPAAVVSELHGFNAGESASENAPPAGFIAVVVTAFPQ